MSQYHTIISDSKLRKVKGKVSESVEQRIKTN